MAQIDFRSKNSGWRTQTTHNAYASAMEAGELSGTCKLCTASTIEEFTYWKIVQSKYPYDAIADVHHLLLPNEHKTEADLSEAEKNELFHLKQGYLNDHYDFIGESTPHSKTIPDHFHLHLLTRHQ